MILVLHGARKNAGDFLIRERGVALIRHLRPRQELVLRDRQEPIERSLYEKADAVVLCGGPGLARNFYPELFPLVRELASLETPILPLALGWSGVPKHTPDRFEFSPSSHEALAMIHSRIGHSSVRDDVSLRIMHAHGLLNSVMSGCTAWYDLPNMGIEPQPAVRVRKLVFTPPHRRRTREAIRVMNHLGRRYQDAERYCVFHRHFRWGQGTTADLAASNKLTAAVARATGWQIVDAAYGTGAIDFYRQCDLHVGYRVHAHLAFLSYRRPSRLLVEDGRGMGVVRTMGDESELWAGSDDLIDRLDAVLDEEESRGHPGLRRAVEKIEATWPVMRETIEQIPPGNAAARSK